MPDNERNIPVKLSNRQVMITAQELGEMIEQSRLVFEGGRSIDSVMEEILSRRPDYGNEKIYTLSLRETGYQVFSLENGFEVLGLDFTKGEITVFIKINESRAKEEYSFVTYANGELLPRDPGLYVGSYNPSVELGKEVHMFVRKADGSLNS